MNKAKKYKVTKITAPFSIRKFRAVGRENKVAGEKFWGLSPHGASQRNTG